MQKYVHFILLNVHFSLSDNAKCLDFDEDSAIYLSACQIIRYCILLVGYVCYPVIAVDVVDTEEIEAIYTQPDILKDTLLGALAVVEQAIAHTDVGTFVGWCSEGIGLLFSVWCREW